jgi:pullulanase/glycogen debranching enzyme
MFQMIEGYLWSMFTAQVGKFELYSGLNPSLPFQKQILEIASKDAYNWGYDPVHWGVPEGSYATDPDGAARILEFRQMVQSLHRHGLRVVLDVVYNHTFRTGPHDVYSILDKVRQ